MIFWFSLSNPICLQIFIILYKVLCHSLLRHSVITLILVLILFHHYFVPSRIIPHSFIILNRTLHLWYFLETTFTYVIFATVFFSFWEYSVTLYKHDEFKWMYQLIEIFPFIMLPLFPIKYLNQSKLKILVKIITNKYMVHYYY